jgi:hypothetical protein
MMCCIVGAFSRILGDIRPDGCSLRVLRHLILFCFCE